MKPVSRYVLAVDLGTSGVKVALITIDGRVAGWPRLDSLLLSGALERIVPGVGQ